MKTPLREFRLPKFHRLHQFKPQDNRVPHGVLRVPEHAELVQATRRPKRQSPPRNQPLVLQQGPPAAFDSHFHLDRTARELWGGNEVSTVTLNDILREPLVPAPNNPVTLIGGVIVFCDPGTTRSIPLMDAIQR